MPEAAKDRSKAPTLTHANLQHEPCFSASRSVLSRTSTRHPFARIEMANRGYDVVVDVDTEASLINVAYNARTDSEQGDLGHTDLQDDDLEFHSSSTSIETTRP